MPEDKLETEVLTPLVVSARISSMPSYPWTYRSPRRPRRLTWYTVITQLFTLIGRLVGRAATSKGGVLSEPTPKKTTRRRR